LFCRPFVDKRVLQEALLALKFDTQFIRKIDPSNEEVLKPKPVETAPVEEEPRLRFGQRLDPKLEKELALKQLSELPTIKRRRKLPPDAVPEPPPKPVVKYKTVPFKLIDFFEWIRLQKSQ